MRFSPAARIAIAIGLVGPLAGCAMLPSSAPTVQQVVRPAAPAGITVTDVADAPAAAFVPPSAPSYRWAIGDAPAWAGEIGVGDTISLTVFEVGYALFGAAEGSTPAGAPSAAGRALPKMEVGPSGRITVPFIGSVNVVGRTAPQVAAEIERRLRGLSQHAQVTVSVERGPGESIVVSGDVHSPGRQPLVLDGVRLVDAIAQAGGPTNRAPDTQVRLTRGGVTAEVRLDQLAANSVENVRLAPGDRVELSRSVRSVTVLGAVRTVSEIPFDSDTLSLAEAVARAGGPLDDKADAAGVFVFRIGPPAEAGKPDSLSIYRLNLLDPRSYFAAQRFYMHPKDVLLIANARSVQFNKLVQTLNTLVSPAITVDLLTR